LRISFARPDAGGSTRQSFQFSVVSNCVAIQVPRRGDGRRCPLRWPTRLPKVRRFARASTPDNPGRALVAKSKELRQRPFRRQPSMPFLMSAMGAARSPADRRFSTSAAAFRRNGALDQRLDEAAVLHHVQLKPERLLDIGGGQSSIEQIGQSCSACREFPRPVRRGRHESPPSPNCIPVSPTGARISGSAGRASPRMVVERSRFRDIDQNALAEFDRLEIVTVWRAAFSSA